MNKLVRIQQGESLPFRFDRGGGDIAGWTCTIELKKYPDSVDLLTGTGRVIDPVDLGWPGFLTNTETSGLSVNGPTGGLHYLIASLVNLTSNELEQIPVRVSVSKKWS